VAAKHEPRRAAALEGACLLLLDDVGAEVDRYKSGEPTERLRALLDARAGHFTVISTNLPPAMWSIRYDARVEDRMLRNSIIVDLHNVPPWTRDQS